MQDLPPRLVKSFSLFGAWTDIKQDAMIGYAAVRILSPSRVVQLALRFD